MCGMLLSKTASPIEYRWRTETSALHYCSSARIDIHVNLRKLEIHSTLTLGSVLRDVRSTPPCQHYDSTPYHFRNPAAGRSCAHCQPLPACIVKVLQSYFPPHLSWSRFDTFLQKVWMLRKVHVDGGFLPQESCVGIHWCRLRMARKRKAAKSWIQWKIFIFSYDVERFCTHIFLAQWPPSCSRILLYGTIQLKHASTSTVDTWSRMNGNTIHDPTPSLTMVAAQKFWKLWSQNRIWNQQT
jgi:hypothetical protein